MTRELYVGKHYGVVCAVNLCFVLDPRIYRTGLVAVALALIVLAFSVEDQQGPLTTNLAPDAFNGQNAYALTAKLAHDYPDRQPGSTGDDALAGHVAQTFGRYGFAVSTTTFTGRTARGKRPLEIVTGTRAGLANGAVLVVAHRDALNTPATTQLSGTATLLELARVLSGETHRRTIMLASTSGSAGIAGATQLARQLGGSIEAVIALGDLASPRPQPPVVVPFSNGRNVAPTVFRNTVGAALTAQTGLGPSDTGLAGQLAHLAFPLTLSEQGPFGTRGVPAVLLSSADERGDSGNGPISQDRITGLGRATLQTINALDSAPNLPTSKPYLLLYGKVVPAWPVGLLVLALILPVLATSVDGLARVSRRGYSVLRAGLWSLLCAAPFLLAFGLIVVARVTGWITATPPGPVGAAQVPLHTSGTLLLIALVALMVLAALALTPLRRLARGGAEPNANDAASGMVVLLIMCAATVGMWLLNPFAALLVIPALHLWMWVLDREIGLYPPAAIAMLLGGVLAPVLVVVYYAVSLGLGPIDAAWSLVLMVAGGHIAPVAATLWCVLLGCVAGAVALVIRGTRAFQPEEAPVTIRGPLSYAGPGSLGGTKSALKR
ncbi:MAG: M28 family peptidase [Solirubrobacterales bacterium]|nr:M28 family peptidase [Solirubrobacterales bacterium]